MRRFGSASTSGLGVEPSTQTKVLLLPTSNPLGSRPYAQMSRLWRPAGLPSTRTPGGHHDRHTPLGSIDVPSGQHCKPTCVVVPGGQVSGGGGDGGRSGG